MSCVKLLGLQNDSGQVVNNSGDLSDALLKYKELITSANKVFGKSWCHTVTNTIIDFIDSHIGKYRVGCQATVKVQLSNGIYHEDIGYCTVEDSTKGLAIENARLSSVTNALVRVLSCFVEMEVEMQKFASGQNSTTNISNIEKTKFPPRRPITPPPPAQSTPKTVRSPVPTEKIQGKKRVNASSTNSNELRAFDSVGKGDSDDADLDIIFESSNEVPEPVALSVPPSNSATTSVTLTEEEIRIERKRKQREKQEEYKRQMKAKEEKEKQNLRQTGHRTNPKF